MPARNIVYFDLETQRALSDVGNAKHKLGVSVAVTYSTARASYHIYHGGDDDLHRLTEELIAADLVVGWNHLQFDYPVLQPYATWNLADQTRNLDMWLEMLTLTDSRIKLNAVATASFGHGKSAGGIDAVKWWQEHKKSQSFAPLRKIAEYCAYDVKVTRCVHEYALEHGLIKYEDKNGRIVEVAVDWTRF